eukprot:TRINITY_DN4043_c1_g2_i1.p5 TRINITY_DN4043_c1_g2~~TRINITY_DN4043_c1_g2_i1.p5  ORF type:complete len:137 (-),score=4.24 TRINITY_DN4043_c1_g2_i1:610-1020(-)
MFVGYGRVIVLQEFEEFGCGALLKIDLLSQGVSYFYWQRSLYEIFIVCCWYKDCRGILNPMMLANITTLYQEGVEEEEEGETNLWFLTQGIGTLLKISLQYFQHQELEQIYFYKYYPQIWHVTLCQFFIWDPYHCN